MLPSIQFLRSIHGLSNELITQLEKMVDEKHIPQKGFLLKPGRVCQNIYFVKGGIFRTFYDKGGKNITAAFSIEGDICVSLDSFFNQQYSVEGIEALENSFVDYITYEQYQYLNANFSDFNTISRLLLERCLVAREQRLFAMWMQPSMDRYNWSLHQMPIIHQRAMARHISSYLGMTEVMLSRNKNGSPRKT